MLERLLILGIFVLAGVVAYRLFNRGRVRQARVTASYDPLMLQLKPNLPSIMLFTADYCFPCKAQQRPTIERLVGELGADAVQFIQVDVENDPDAAQRWGVMSLPTTYILDRDGQPHEVNHGVTSAETLKRQLQAVR